MTSPAHGGLMLYFAYGSNMDWTQMRGRCPSAQFVAIASLPDYRLCFPRYSTSRGCGVASIGFQAGNEVWGPVYRLDDADRNSLDRCEGFRPGRDPAHNSYEPIEITVLKDGRAAEPLDALTYIARPQQGTTPCEPNEEYTALILAGARQWRLPAEYLRSLEAICANR